MEDEDSPEIEAEIIDDEDADEESDEESHKDRIASFEKGYEFGHDDASDDDVPEEDYSTDVDDEGNLDYEDSNVYEETGMIKSNLFMLAKKSLELHDEIGDSDDLPEWVQEKIAVASYMMDTVHDYLMYEMVKGDIHEKKDGRSKTRKYKGKEYHATPSMVKAVKKGASYNQLAKLAKWSDEPAAVVQAAKIVAKGKPMSRDDEGDLEEGDAGWEPLHQSTGIMFFEDEVGVDYPTPKSKGKKHG
jgi:hypothetical protein